MSIEQWMDTERWPMDRLESAIIQLLNTALRHPERQEAVDDLRDASTVLNQRSQQEYAVAIDAYMVAAEPHKPMLVQNLEQAYQRNMRRAVLTKYA